MCRKLSLVTHVTRESVSLQFEDPTLLRLSEEDVALLDMDEVIVEVEELSHSDEDLDDSESGG